MTRQLDKDAEQRLIAGVISGNPQAFRPLVETYWGLVASIVSRYIRNPETADDICQEVFLAAYSSIQTFCGDCRFSPWIAKIAVNKSLEHLRREKRASFVDYDLDTILSGIQSPDAVLNDRQFFDDCLASLPENLQVMFLLRHGLDFSYDDMALVLEVPVGTVKSLLFRIRSHLKNFLEKRENTEKVLSSGGQPNNVR